MLYITIGLVILALLVLGGYSIGTYFYDLAINRYGKKDIVFAAEHNKIESDPEKKDSTEDLSEWFRSIDPKDVAIQSDDNLHLGASLAENPASNTWVILTHGYTAEGKYMVGSARPFYEHGYSILIPDLRGHGRSEGNYIGFGWHDRIDVLRWIEYINRYNHDVRIILYGVSMGAATVMMTSGEQALPENVDVIIEDCGYTTAADVCKYQIKQLFKIPPFLILPAADIITKIRAGYSLYEASALDQVRKSTTPILFIHGDQDTFVPFRMIDVLYNAAHCPKEKLIIAGAGHGGAQTKDPERYWNTVFNFIHRYLND